jgi:hypothetical protein
VNFGMLLHNDVEDWPMSHSRLPDVPLLDRLAWDVGEYAALAGCSPAFVWKLLRDGKLGSVKVAGRRVIPREAGLKLLKLADTEAT